jgi:hypothetical protein
MPPIVISNTKKKCALSIGAPYFTKGPRCADFWEARHLLGIFSTSFFNALIMHVGFPRTWILSKFRKKWSMIIRRSVKRKQGNLFVE